MGFILYFLKAYLICLFVENQKSNKIPFSFFEPKLFFRPVFLLFRLARFLSPLAIPAFLLLSLPLSITPGPTSIYFFFPLSSSSAWRHCHRSELLNRHRFSSFFFAPACTTNSLPTAAPVPASSFPFSRSVALERYQTYTSCCVHRRLDLLPGHPSAPIKGSTSCPLFSSFHPHNPPLLSTPPLAVIKDFLAASRTSFVTDSAVVKGSPPPTSSPSAPPLYVLRGAHHLAIKRSLEHHCCR